MIVEVLPALGDNYIYVVHEGSDAAVVDPGDAVPVLALLQRQHLTLRTVLLTHAHGDHVAGAPALRAQTDCQVVGPAGSGLPELDRSLKDGDRVAVPGGELQAIATPGHLAAHLSYYDAANEVLFSGDTLFAGGCGRIMGSSPAKLWESLLRLRALPSHTHVYCGHEYTVNNLEFAVHLEPEHRAVAERLAVARAKRAQGQPTVPSTLALERATNPFLRADDPVLQRVLGMPTARPVEVFTEVRHRKDQW